MRKRLSILLLVFLVATAAQADNKRFFQQLDALRPDVRQEGLRTFAFGPGRSVGVLVEESGAVPDWVLQACGKLKRRAPGGRLLVGTAAALQKQNLECCLVPLSSRQQPPESCAIPNASAPRLEVIDVQLPDSALAESRVVIGQAVLEVQSQSFDGVEEARLKLERFTPRGARFSLKSFDEEGRQHTLARLREYFDQQLSGPNKAVITLPAASSPLPPSLPRLLRVSLSRTFGAEHVGSWPPVEDSILQAPTWNALLVPVVKIWMNDQSRTAPDMLEQSLRELLRPL